MFVLLSAATPSRLLTAFPARRAVSAGCRCDEAIARVAARLAAEAPLESEVELVE